MQEEKLKIKQTQINCKRKHIFVSRQNAHVGSAAAGTLVSSLSKHAGQIQLSNKLQANGG